MSETTQAPSATPKLNEALAAFQAEMPQVSKGETGKVEKDGRLLYTYKYADLASVCAAALPVLGKHGLSFFAKPAILGSQFGMICKLKHSCGEEEQGFYPLPSSGTPQQVGSAITYARRYSMLMMTGLAPAEDDDAAANTTQRFAPHSAAEAFENASPARPDQRAGDDGPLPENPWVTEHLILIAEMPTEEDGRALWRKVAAAGKDRDISRDDARRLQDLITARITELRKTAPGGSTYGLAVEDDWLIKVQSVTSQEDADAAAADVATSAEAGHISTERGALIIAAIDARMAELTGKAAA